ncbi:beta strand repeat-containing protein [Prescottella defluvii]|uniref:beta strand repeat-containing protein n=1 Tax=Prescottella defluvii TaxID=1323361 RepID=UPI0004F3E438|nr:Ig-like domain-containing protein [Prescottella defluvii]
MPLTGTALVAGTFLIGSPANAVVKTTNFTSACVAGSTIGDQHKNVAASMTVDAPATVAPGEVFTYRIQPNASSYPDKESIATTTNLSRLKYDYELPANTEWVSGAVVPGTAIGLDNVAPNVLLVNDSGVVDASGRVIRLSGNNQVAGNSPTSSTNSEGGIRAPKTKKNLDGSASSNGDTWFRLPAVDVTVRALDPGVITPRVRIAGNAANHGDYANFSTSVAKASAFIGTQWAPTRCTPRDNKDAALNAGSGPLATINVVAEQESTTTTLTAPATAETGASVTLTANVAPGNATGSVQFQDNGNDIGSPVTVSGGSASLDHTFTNAGSHSVTAVFTATGSFTGSTSAASTITVTDPTPVDVATTLGLTVPQTAETGASVDLTANVTPADAQGTVQFKDNGNNIGSPVTVVSGAATLSHEFTTAGARSITAEFTGAPGFTGSTAGAQTVTVTDPVVPDVETTTTVSAPADAATGADVTLTANVAPQNATGTVQFTADGNNIGSPVAVSNGVATLSYAFDTAGTVAVGAAFTGDAGFASSSAQTRNVTVTDPVTTTTTELTVPQAAEAGAPVDLTATIAPQNAVGSVQFQDNGTDIGQPVTVSNGVATLSHQFTSAGSHSITATFTGGAGFAGSTAGAQTVTVTDPVVPDTETTTTVTAPGTAETGASVTLSAAVAPVPTGGTVQFKVAGNDVGTPVNVDGTGHASMPYTFNAAGSYAVTAEFSGATGFTASTGSAQTVTVSDPAPQDVETSLGLQVPATAETDASVNLTATVTPSDAEGTVQFKSNGANIGSPVTVSGGTAVLSHAFGVAGVQSVTAEFTGATGFTNSSASAQTVTVSDPTPVDAATTTILSVPGNAKTDESQDLVATVFDNGTEDVIPSAGTVEFFDNGASIGTVPVVDGVATLSHAFTAAGTHTITATFSGANGFTSSSAEAKQIVVTVPTAVDVETTTVVTVPGNATVGTQVQLSAQVTGAGDAAVAGTVQFFDGQNPIGDAVPVVNGVATLNHTFTTAGAHSIHAEFSGAQGVANSNSAAQTVQVSGGNSGGSLGNLGTILRDLLGGLNFGS